MPTSLKKISAWDRETLLSSPIFAPLRPMLAQLNTETFPTLQDCNALLANITPKISVYSGLPLKFVHQSSGRLAFEAQYEPRCYLTGEVQMRENNRHDLFNALVWLTFPKSKSAINARHYAALTGRRTGSNTTGASQRGAERDVSTLVDESGVIVASADETLTGLLRSFKWKELFWQCRNRLSDRMGFYLFGHGLYEKALNPYVGMTGQGLLFRVEPAFFSRSQTQQLSLLDTLLANYLSAPQYCRSARELSPVPLLGVPGWTADNLKEEYYDNSGYFRSGRRASGLIGMRDA